MLKYHMMHFHFNLFAMTSVLTDTKHVWETNKKNRVQYVPIVSASENVLIGGYSWVLQKLSI